jgi:hypothetical protein
MKLYRSRCAPTQSIAQSSPVQSPSFRVSMSIFHILYVMSSVRSCTNIKPVVASQGLPEKQMVLSVLHIVFVPPFSLCINVVYPISLSFNEAINQCPEV